MVDIKAMQQFICADNYCWFKYLRLF